MFHVSNTAGCSTCSLCEWSRHWSLGSSSTGAIYGKEVTSIGAIHVICDRRETRGTQLLTGPHLHCHKTKVEGVGLSDVGRKEAGVPPNRL